MVDAFDAMTSARAYRSGRIPVEAISELRRCTGTDFDGTSVEALIAALPRLVATGEAVNLVMNGAVVEGRSAVTNQLVFTVSVDRVSFLAISAFDKPIAMCSSTSNSRLVNVRTTASRAG